MLTSLIATSRAFGIDPFAYLRDNFTHISAHPQTRLADLLPRPVEGGTAVGCSLLNCLITLGSITMSHPGPTSAAISSLDVYDHRS